MITLSEHSIPSLCEDADGNAPGWVISNARCQSVDVPQEFYELVKAVAAALANNQAVSVVPTNMDLTTNQAADVLNVSRTFVIKLIEKGELPHRMVGTHRRVALTDALAYREKMDKRTDKALDELARIDQELGLND